MKKALSSLALGAILATSLVAKGEADMPKNVVSAWDKTFAKSDKVNHKKVAFKNRYGIVIVADLYTPKNMNGKLPAIAISGPYGAVKEQSSGLHAQTLAERGFVTIAFDGSFTGESGGEVRDISSPDINTEDFSAAVDYLGVQDFVDREKIGIIGICGWGGFALNAAISDTRIKAVVATTMYDMTRVTAKGYNDSVGENERYEAKKALNLERWTDFENGKTSYGANGLSGVKDSDALFLREYRDYYRTDRGYHKRSLNSNGAWSNTNSIILMSDKILTYANELRAPVLLAHGEIAHSRYFSEDAFKELGSKNKELFIVPGASHTDLYDKKIPFDKFEEFFKANLK